jgi:NADPH-dependent curcumin reductase CurA
MRFKMTEGNNSFEIGRPINGCGCGVVIESNHPDYEQNDIISTFRNWDWIFSERVLLRQNDLEGKKKFSSDMIDPSLYPTLVGALGMPGLTAYGGFNLFGKPESGKTIIISGACGAVGSIAGQIAKSNGLSVVGITSTQEKADVLVNELGFDNVILHRGRSREELIQEIRRTCPNGIDYYFDNVGGEVSNAVHCCLNNGAKVSIIGQISQYHNPNFKRLEELPGDIENIVKEKNIQRESFVTFQRQDIFEEGFQYLFDLVKDGKIKHKETIYEGIEKWPDALIGLFQGENIGKAMVRIN